MLNKFIQVLIFFVLVGFINESGSPVHYDIILVAGQSNTHYGIGLDTSVDRGNSFIKQLGRKGKHNYKIIAANEPLEHWTPAVDCIGFALPFARSYQKKLLQKGRKILIIPCGYGSTGFWNRGWNKGDSLYEDAVKRTRYALSLDSCNKLVAILWHQGESDIGYANYQQAIDSMIVNMRKDIEGGQRTPFLLGGMTPHWVEKDQARVKIQKIIAGTPQRIQNTAFVSPYYPFRIRNKDPKFVPVHYDAVAQKVLGARYFSVYDSLRTGR